MVKRKGNASGTIQSLFLRLEDLVVANSGEDEFTEIFKLVVAKLWDERKHLGLFRSGGSHAIVAARLGALLRQVDEAWPGILPSPQSHLTPEHLNVCVEALEGHLLGDDNLEALDGLFESLVARAAKGVKGQFFTPRYVIELVVRMLQPQMGERLLDPACGSGGFLMHALNYVRRTQAPADRAALAPYVKHCLWGFDVDGRAVRVAKTMMMAAAGVEGNIFRANSLLRPTSLGRQHAEAPLCLEEVCGRARAFDLIMTNPPFAGEVREPHILGSYALAQGKARIERDVLFLERCMDLLRPGGRMGIVLPHNVMGSDTLRFVRQWLVKKGRILAAVGLGRHTFLPHTHQKASVLFVQREDNRFSDYNIFFAISQRDGKDSKGSLIYNDAHSDDALWTRIDHDFPAILTAFTHFCTREGLSLGGGA